MDEESKKDLHELIGILEENETKRESDRVKNRDRAVRRDWKRYTSEIDYEKVFACKFLARVDDKLSDILGSGYEPEEIDKRRLKRLKERYRKIISAKMDEETKKDLHELIEILEENEAKRESDWVKNRDRAVRKSWKTYTADIDYEKMFACKFLARVDDKLSDILGSGYEPEEIDKRRLKRLKKSDNKIDRLMQLMQSDLFDHFYKENNNLVHADAAIWNFGSIEYEDSRGRLREDYVLDDWERVFVNANPQYSLWFLIATAADDPDERKKIQEGLLEHAFKSRFNIRKVNDSHREEFEQFKETYDRMDVFMSMIHTVRLLGWMRSASEKGNMDTAGYLEEIAVKTYRHTHEVMEKLGLHEMSKSLDEVILHTFNEDDVVTLGLADREFYQNMISKKIGMRGYEKLHRKVERWAPFKSFINRIKKPAKILAVPAAAALATIVTLMTNYPEGRIEYVRGHQPTIEEPYFMAEDAPADIIAVGLTDDAQDGYYEYDLGDPSIVHSETISLTRGNRAGINVILGRTGQVNEQIAQVGFSQDGKTIWLHPAYWDATDTTRWEDAQITGFNVPRKLEVGPADLHFLIENFEGEWFRAEYKTHILSEPEPPLAKKELIRCFYDNIREVEFQVEPSDISKGDWITFDAFAEFYMDRSCAVSTSEMDFVMKLNFEDTLTRVTYKRERCEREPAEVAWDMEGKKFNTTATVNKPCLLKFFTRGNLPGIRIEKLPDVKEGKITANLYAQITDIGSTEKMPLLWIDSRDIGIKNPQEFIPKRKRGPGVEYIKGPVRDFSSGKEEDIEYWLTHFRCTEKNILRAVPGSVTNLEFLCSGGGLGSEKNIPETDEVRYRAAIYELGLKSDIMEKTVEIRPRKTHPKFVDWRFFESVDFSIPITIPEDTPAGTYRIFIEYLEDNRKGEIKKALTGLIDIGKDGPRPATFREFIDAAIDDPDGFICAHKHTSEDFEHFRESGLKGSRSFYECVAMMDFIESEAGKSYVEFDYEESTTPSWSMIEYEKGTTYVIFDYCGEGMEWLSGSNAFFSNHFRLHERHPELRKGFRRKHPDREERPKIGVIENIRSGDSQYLFICTDYMSPQELRKTFADPKFFEPEATSMTVKEDEVTYTYLDDDVRKKDGS